MLNFLKDIPVIGILRDIPEGEEVACANTASKAGLKAIEVTMNTANAPFIIERLKAACSSLGIMVGAGTVRTIQDFDLAKNAGAEFMVAPSTIPAVIQRSVAANLPIIPGALSPTEVQTAFELGATCVKIFPINAVGGASYIRDLRGPFRDVPLLACGGVSENNVQDYLEAGANLVAFGGSIFKPLWMREHQWNLIEEKLKIFLAAVKKAKQ
ncbi:MAG: bifunctional 4-hydroxy-2-oxoglutarate aldolase/2-dehydro-3-deoxy-phosphogluconate aldolase [Fibrobacteraceae bacterium]